MASTPPSLAQKPELKQRFEQAVRSLGLVYGELLAGGVPAEDARYLLPNACETKIVVTMNARELLHFFALRCCNRAQWEIHDLADEMLRQVKKIAPALFSQAGPGCAAGACPEGAKSCGNLADVREKYANF